MRVQIVIQILLNRFDVFQRYARRLRIRKLTIWSCHWVVFISWKMHNIILLTSFRHKYNRVCQTPRQRLLFTDVYRIDVLTAVNYWKFIIYFCTVIDRSMLEKYTSKFCRSYKIIIWFISMSNFDDLYAFGAIDNNQTA